MAANPGIIAAVGSKAADLLIQALIENTGLRGLVRLKGYNKDTGVCVQDGALQTTWCVPATTNPYISQIFFLANVYKTSTPFFSSGCLGAFYCTSGENCDTGACSYWNTSPSSDLVQQKIVLETKANNLDVQLTNIENKRANEENVEKAWESSAKTKDDCAMRLAAHRDVQLGFIKSYQDKYAKYTDLVTRLEAEKTLFKAAANAIIDEFKTKEYSVSLCNDYYSRVINESRASESRTQALIKLYVDPTKTYEVACKGWTNQAACQKAECFWYDNACHQAEACWISNPLGGCVLSAKTGRAVVGATAAIFLTAAAYWLFTRKREEVVSIYAGAREAAAAEAARARAAYKELRAPGAA